MQWVVRLAQLRTCKQNKWPGSFEKSTTVLGADNRLQHSMAETDPKSVQDLTNVVSPVVISFASPSSLA